MPRAKHARNRKCVICGDTFRPANRRNTCCSADCSQERKRRCAAAWYAEHRDELIERVMERRKQD